VFNLKVPFPVVPPPTAREDAKSSQMNSEWDQARRTLAEGASGEFSQEASDDNSGRYNPKLVEVLKKRAIELLRNASHLRHVEADEWVVVTFEGPPNGVNRRNGLADGPWGVRRNFFRRPRLDAFAPTTAVAQDDPAAPTSNQMNATQPGGTGGQGTANPLAQSTGQAANSAGDGTAAAGLDSGTAGSGKKTQSSAAAPPERITVMTIRVKKKDVDAFASDKVTEEQFIHNAEVVKYLGPVAGNDGENGGSDLLTR
jgi:hypothetical protein